MEVVRRPPTVRDEQKTEPDLGDEQCLDEGEDMAENPAGIAPSKVREPAPDGRDRRRDEHGETHEVMGVGHAAANV